MKYEIKTTKSQELVDITNIVREAVRKNDVNDGIVTVFIPHTTAGVTINENADPDVVTDMLSALNKAFPVENGYLHVEGNSHAHIKASLMGSSCNVIVENGELLLGTWQGIYFCEFDGPRSRKIYIEILRD
ncbi:secondary thiamine-phosphate synthase enzyme YjbQ [Clostridium pasteurianum]|uniref:Secondary thiamine-phosphate synthase enzyme n=1 Tax=Clostridium pasteurianum BC1 TaxID=86416 RepID=R4K8P0_CLOPA|nr:secondary thiamine-phosphate synthase enzyme YjbQ [Clostridium pasteurianum]AGK96914.1 secondary thiamine-phosphate synthase enzyme [Clostridium pasteurianum BC1]